MIELTLDSGLSTTRAGINPELGAGLMYFSINDKQVLRCFSECEIVSPLEMASFVCAPYFGRLPTTLKFDLLYHLGLTVPRCDAEHAIHGESWIANWEVRKISQSKAIMVHEYSPSREGGWPFPYEATLIVELSIVGILMRLVLKNTHDKDAPAGLAFHPFFKRTTETTIHFESCAVWSPNLEGDSGNELPFPDEIGQGKEAHLSEELRNHTYLGFGGKVMIRDLENTILLKSDAPMIHLYSPVNQDFFCLEPVNHAPSLFQNCSEKNGAQILKPGEQTSLNMQLQVYRSIV